MEEQKTVEQTEQPTPQPQSFLSNLNWKYISIGLAVVLVVGIGAFWVGKQSNQTITSPICNQNQAKTEDEWKNVNIGWYGISFDYPSGWHVVYDASAYNNGFLIGSVPFDTLGTHGPESEFIISVRNGFEDPLKEFNSILEKRKSELAGYREDIISSNQFNKIYYISGTIPDTGLGSAVAVNEYIFTTLDQTDLHPKTTPGNILIITASPTGHKNSFEKINILEQIVKSISLQ